MKRSVVLAAVLTVAVLVPLLTGPNAPVRRWIGAATPPVLGEVPPFVLVADDGRPFDSATLEGRAWLASFLYTSCPGPCPLLVERLKTVRKSIPPARLAFVSISVDPAADTPEVLTAYKTRQGIASGDAWTFVTGPPDDVIALVQRGFLTGVERTDGGAPEGAVTHGTRVALIDGKRHIRGFYSTESDDDLKQLKRDVAALD